MTLILSGTDGLSDVDGSAATPAVRGTDTNTGIFFPAADTIAFAEGGVEVARITNTAAWSFGASGTNTGTNGQVLTSAGSGAAPTWATPSGGVTSIAAGSGLSGGTITSTGTISINTNNSVGVGAYAFITTAPGSSSVADGATTSGSNLLLAFGNGSGAWQASVLNPSGTWRNVTGFTISGNGGGYGLFIRTA